MKLNDLKKGVAVDRGGGGARRERQG